MIAYVEERNQLVDDDVEKEEEAKLNLTRGERLSCVLQRVLIASKE